VRVDQEWLNKEREMTKNMLAIGVMAAGLALPAVAAGQGHAGHADAKDLVQVATEAGSFTTLLTAVQAAGLVDVLRGEGPFTVFAPTDEAFAKLPPEVLQALLADPERLAAVLTYHVVPGRVMAADVVRSGQLDAATVQGERLRIVVRNGKVYVDGATVIAADIAASNGVIHVIDTVVLPGARNARTSAPRAEFWCNVRGTRPRT
jgi:uncharacterized surface protein with fasciclin (FAS1) repeats